MATDLNDLNEQSTSEDVQNYVNQVLEEVEADRAGDDRPSGKAQEKSDAQITSEQAGLEQPGNNAVESSSDSDETVDDIDENTGDEAVQDWLTDDIKAEAAAYGIGEDELSEFTDREELERALKFFAKSALDAGRKAMADADGDGEPVRNEKGQFVKKEVPEETPAAKSDGRYEIDLDTDIYEEELVNTLTGMRDHYEARLQALEANFQEAAARSEEQQFDSLVDKLGHTDLFGVTDKETAEQLERRQDLLVAIKAQQIGLERLGRRAELTESFVNRVAKMVFADELAKKELKQRTRKISRQSNSRQGGGATRPQDPREDPRDEADRLYRELEGLS